MFWSNNKSKQIHSKVYASIWVQVGTMKIDMHETNINIGACYANINYDCQQAMQRHTTWNNLCNFRQNNIPAYRISPICAQFLIWRLEGHLSTEYTKIRSLFSDSGFFCGLRCKYFYISPFTISLPVLNLSTSLYVCHIIRLIQQQLHYIMHTIIIIHLLQTFLFSITLQFFST